MSAAPRRKSKALPLGERLVGLLKAVARPLTVNELLANDAVPGVDQAALRAALEEQVALGTIFEAPRARDEERFWGRDPGTFATEKLRELLGKGPRSARQLVSELAKALPFSTSGTWRKRQVAGLKKQADVFVHPPRGRSRVGRLALEPADPAEYLSAKVVGPLEVVFKKLEKARVPAKVVFEALTARLKVGATSSGDAGATAGNPEQVQTLLLQGMRELEPDADRGALVPLRRLRNWLPVEFRASDLFGQAVLSLAESEAYTLHPHAGASSLSAAEREELVQDGRGNFFMGISKRM